MRSCSTEDIYDSETKLYYCGSRYYNPQIRRFINADGYVSTGGGFLSYNVFTYCNNNSAMYCDPTGECMITYACGGDDPWPCGQKYTGTAGHLFTCSEYEEQLQQEAKKIIRLN